MLLLVLLTTWVLAGVLLVGICRSAAFGDAALHEGLKRWSALHWGELER